MKCGVAACRENSADERQTEDILQRKRADESRTKRTEGWRKFRQETDSFDPNGNSTIILNAPAGREVVNVQCVEGKLDLECGIDLILDARQACHNGDGKSAESRTKLFFKKSQRCWLVCRVNFNVICLDEIGRVVTGDRYADNLISFLFNLISAMLQR